MSGTYDVEAFLKSAAEAVAGRQRRSVQTGTSRGPFPFGETSRPLGMSRSRLERDQPSLAAAEARRRQGSQAR
ncbi:MAG: hypothetical protein GEU82_07790 [Luteitalea sp.]|nr:hypothetical protein [Luteitalea sp.]